MSAERVGRRLAPILAADVPGTAADGAETLPDHCAAIAARPHRQGDRMRAKARLFTPSQEMPGPLDLDKAEQAALIELLTGASREYSGLAGVPAVSIPPNLRAARRKDDLRWHCWKMCSKATR